MVNLEWLSAFVVFTEHMNFTHAARALHLSQPALHAQIGKLSEQLGVPLYEKRGRQLVLTAEGERVVGFGREMEARTGAFVDGLRGRGEVRPVVLAAGGGSYLYLLGEAIRSFKRQSAAPLRLLTLRGEETAKAVRSGRAQLGVAALDVVPEDLVGDVMTSVGMALVIPEDHPLVEVETVSLGELEGLALVVPPPGQPHRQTIEVALRAEGVPWSVAVEASGWELTLHFVSLGLGVAVVNAFCTPPVGFVMRPVPALPSRTYFVLRRPGSPPEGAAGELRALMLASADGWRQGF